MKFLVPALKLYSKDRQALLTTSRLERNHDGIQDAFCVHHHHQHNDLALKKCFSTQLQSLQS